MVRLSVNINKVALIRNSRESNLPDLVEVAKDCERFGAQGITVHPRPDERHIKYADIPALKQIVTTEFNIEGYPSDKFVELVLTNKPDQVTLVPDPPGVLTSCEGWDTEKHQVFLKDIISVFKNQGIRTSLFLESRPDLIPSTKETGTDRIELYTGSYAEEYKSEPNLAVQKHIETAKEAQKHGLGINAGHDLNLDNLKYYASEVPGLQEVSIGHALISDALHYGLQNTIGMYLRLLN